MRRGFVEERGSRGPTPAADEEQDGPMYAVIEIGGRQWKVAPGTQLQVNRLQAEVGAEHAVDRVLLTHDGSQMHVGHPYVDGAKIICEVVAHCRGPKTVSYKYRRRENYRRTVGHRQDLTQLRVKEIATGR